LGRFFTVMSNLAEISLKNVRFLYKYQQNNKDCYLYQSMLKSESERSIFMNVSLTPELEQIINSKVQSGLYNSASEVVRVGIRLLQQRDEQHELKLEALRTEIQKGIDDLEAGRFRDGREAMAEKRELLLRMKEQNG
jgi:antitoxin ParD1/3/4